MELRNPVDLFALWPQDQSEAELYAASATVSVLTAANELDGALTSAETVATSRPGSGARCLVMAARVAKYEPGMHAEHASASIVERMAAAVISKAGLRPPAVFQVARARWLQELASTPQEVASRSWDRWSAASVDVVGQVLHRLVANGRPERQLRVGLVAEVPAEIDLVDLGVPLRAIQRVIRLRADSEAAEAAQALADGCPDRARACEEVMREIATNLSAQIDSAQQQFSDEADGALSAANAIIGQISSSATVAQQQSGWSTLLRWCNSLFGADDVSADETVRGGLDQVAEHLQVFAAAALHARLVAQLGGLLADLVRRADELRARIAREMDLIESIRDAARDHRLRVEHDADELQSITSGIVTAAHDYLREPVVASFLQRDEGQLILAVLSQPIASVRAQMGSDDSDTVLAEVMEAARELTAAIRATNFDQFIRRFDQDALGRFAASLRPEISSEFRPGQPKPGMTLRFSVPGGEDGVLGRWLRTNLRDVQPQVMAAGNALVAYGVLTSDVFEVDALREYHTSWREARELGRRQGWDAKLVSDRRYLTLDDGYASDEKLDRVFVKGLLVERVLPSQEPPKHRAVGGTYYVRRDGEERRPSEVPAASLDALFGRLDKGGGRLGASVPECRVTLKTNAQMRDLIERAYGAYCQTTSPEERLQALATLERADALPSPELLPTVQELRIEIDEEIARLGHKVGVRRRRSNLKSVVSE